MTTRWPLIELQTSVHPLAALRPVVVQGGRNSADCLVPNQQNHRPNQLAESKIKKKQLEDRTENRIKQEQSTHSTQKDGHMVHPVLSAPSGSPRTPSGRDISGDEGGAGGVGGITRGE